MKPCNGRSIWDREGVIREVIESRLLGRGGAAFPTGKKWEALLSSAISGALTTWSAMPMNPSPARSKTV